MIIITSLLFVSQVLLTCAYVMNIMPASKLVRAFTVINFLFPSLVLMSLVWLKCKFSGVPRIDEFKSKLAKLLMAVLVWSFARLIRGITSIWDIELLFGMMFEIHTVPEVEERKDTSVLFIPMALIVMFLVVEIWPIWVVLDGGFVDIFLKQSVLIEQKDL